MPGTKRKHEIESASLLIVIVAQAGIGFPNGTAPTARITCYARGLKAAGKDVLVLCLGTSEPSPPAPATNTLVGGISPDHIPFQYTCGSTVRSLTFWRRRRDRLRGLLGAARGIRHLHKRESVEAILLYSDSPLEALVTWTVSRHVGAIHLAEVNEMPFHTPRPGILWRLRRNVYNRTFYRLFDAGIAISDRLERHVMAYGSPTVAVLRAPVMVDTDAFHPRADSVMEERTILYCGLLNEHKDGVGTLMTAFAGIANEMPDVRLVLVGDTYTGTRIPEFRILARALSIEDSVVFVGNVQRSEVPAFLSKASVLALARPSSPQADAGMPTKVAEYLASAVPVVLTQIGEVAAFLESGINAYLIPPDDVVALERALRHVLLNPEEARVVGRRGRDVAIRHFDYRVTGAKLAGFIDALRNKTRAS